MSTLLLDCVPDDFDVDSDGDGYVCTVPVWHNADYSRYMVLDCRLDPMPDHGPDTFEFSFRFTVSDLDGVEPTFSTQDRYEVRAHLGDLTAEFIMPTVCSAIVALVSHVQPSYIFRVTKARSLPQCAMAKHQLVTDAFYDLGYHMADTGTDDFDRTFWLMAR